MNKMEKPPVLPVSKEKQLELKKHQEALKKVQESEKEKWRQFRSDVESSVKRLQEDVLMKSLSFPSMEKSKRQVIHDIIDSFGESLVSHSFGIEDIDRHVVVYKKQYLPCEDELNCLKKGISYDPEQIEEERKRKSMEEMESNKRTKKTRHEETNSNYKDKYSHLIGSQAGLSAATATVANKSYGFVPAENKKDQRSIEQTLRDIQEKKRIKNLKKKEETREEENKQKDDLEEDDD